MLKSKKVHQISTVLSPASCGELVQGYLDNEPFLINCPINLYAKASIYYGESMSRSHKIFPKAIAAAQALYHQDQHSIQVSSQIPRGKGMASSTAEISAAIAMAMMQTNSFSMQKLHHHSLSVDHSTDATYLPGIIKLNHLSGEIQASYQKVPALYILAIDQGGTIQTDQVDRERFKHHARKYQSEFRQALHLIERGFHESNARKVAQAATISSTIHQQIEPHLYYQKLITLIEEQVVLGINRAHTGTVLGLMYDRKKISQTALEAIVSRRIPQQSIIGSFKLISGGLRRESKRRYLSRFRSRFDLVS